MASFIRDLKCLLERTMCRLQIRCGKTVFDTVARSYSKNNKGPTIEPWATPHVKDAMLDLQLLT